MYEEYSGVISQSPMIVEPLMTDTLVKGGGGCDRGGFSNPSLFPPPEVIAEHARTNS